VNSERIALQLRYKRVCNLGLSEPLRKAGFKRNGRSFIKWIGEDFCYVVWPYRSKVTLPKQSSFTIDCHVFVAATWQVYPEYVPSRRRPFGHTIKVRISEICGDRGDKWWDLHSRDSPGRDDEIIADLRQRVPGCVLPWFEQFRTARDIGDYLAALERGPGRARFGYREIVQSAGDLRSAAIAYFAAGEFDLARRMLELAERTVNIPVSAEMNADLRARLEKLIAEKTDGKLGPSC
jgi:hypothetical protein